MVAIALGTFLGQLKASVMVLLMVTGGEALEDYAMESANRDVEAVLEQVEYFCFYFQLNPLSIFDLVFCVRLHLCGHFLCAKQDFQILHRLLYA